MAENKAKGAPNEAQTKTKDKLQQANNVSQLPSGCLSDGCKTKVAKAGFCMEHFEWFKEGLITREGRKPSDFEKKFFDFQRRKQKSKVA